ncbi:uncharacterized protein [Castor canadensis]|uniref:Uncharacterized protein n=1 Tax=Castor canadensis TaxID=51338 RepID=A0AC58K211_CASCN
MATSTFHHETPPPTIGGVVRVAVAAPPAPTRGLGSRTPRAGAAQGAEAGPQAVAGLPVPLPEERPGFETPASSRPSPDKPPARDEAGQGPRRGRGAAVGDARSLASLRGKRTPHLPPWLQREEATSSILSEVLGELGAHSELSPVGTGPCSPAPPTGFYFAAPLSACACGTAGAARRRGDAATRSSAQQDGGAAGCPSGARAREDPNTLEPWPTRSPGPAPPRSTLARKRSPVRAPPRPGMGGGQGRPRGLGFVPRLAPVSGRPAPIQIRGPRTGRRAP